MILNPPDLDISKNSPFDPDPLERMPHIKYLTQFVSTIKEPFVLAIDAPWGTGKTHFVTMWKYYLAQESISVPCIYFNAWENDFTKDPFIALFSEFKSLQDRAGKEKKGELEKLYNKTKKLAIPIVKKGLPAAMKAATLGLVDLEAGTEAFIASISEKIAIEAIESYEQDKKTTKSFRDELEKYLKEVSENSPKKTPAVFFIDELDRCRPTWAIELLERLKHLFNIPGVVFVLSMDKKELAHSLCGIYGEKMNTEGYLKRFINLEYNLPEPPTGSFCEVLFNRFGLDSYFDNRKLPTNRDEKNPLMTTFTALANLFDLKLRDQERCFTIISICTRVTGKTEWLYPEAIVLLAITKTTNQMLFEAITTDVHGENEFLDYAKTKKTDVALFKKSSEWPTVKATIFGLMPPGRDKNSIYEGLLSAARNHNLDDYQDSIEDQTIQALRKITCSNSIDIPTDYLLKKMTISDAFE